MTKLEWGQISAPYEAGVDRGVFYPKNESGYAWSGLVTVNESSTDENQSLIYIDGVGHQNQLLIGSFAATIEALTYPKEFEPFDGYDDILSAQRRRIFDFTYRTLQEDGHYKIHLVYNALAKPTIRNRSTINTTVDVNLFSWSISTTPETIPDAKASSHFVIDTKLVNEGVISEIERRLYGDEQSSPSMPSGTELLEIFESYALFKVTPHGDGTVTISGTDEAVYEVDDSLWILYWPSVVQVEDHLYQASSL